MTRLSRLRLEQCEITDAGIPHLQAIPSPEMYVSLQGTKVTSVKAGELRVRPVGSRGEPRAGQILLIQGSYTVEFKAFYTADAVMESWLALA